jgi:hypothetical protein
MNFLNVTGTNGIYPFSGELMGYTLINFRVISMNYWEAIHGTT